jgi:hypothetical protein
MLTKMVRWTRPDGFIHEKREKKVCTKCKKEKNIDQFQKISKTYDGRGTECISCIRDRANKNREQKKNDPFKFLL